MIKTNFYSTEFAYPIISLLTLISVCIIVITWGRRCNMLFDLCSWWLLPANTFRILFVIAEYITQTMVWLNPLKLAFYKVKNGGIRIRRVNRKKENNIRLMIYQLIRCFDFARLKECTRLYRLKLKFKYRETQTHGKYWI